MRHRKPLTSFNAIDSDGHRYLLSVYTSIVSDLRELKTSDGWDVNYERKGVYRIVLLDKPLVYDPARGKVTNRSKNARQFRKRIGAT